MIRIEDTPMILAYLIFGYTLYKNDKNGILTGSILFNLLIGIYFFLVGSMVAVISCFIGIFRSLYFKNNERQNKDNPMWSLILFSGITIASVIIFYEALNDILIGILALTSVIIYWFNGSEKIDKTMLVKLGTPVISICYIVYAITIESFIMIPLEIIIVIGGSFGGFKWLNQGKVNKGGI